MLSSLKPSMPGFKASMIRSGPRYSRTIVREGDVFGANFFLHVYRKVSRSRVKRERQPETIMTGIEKHVMTHGNRNLEPARLELVAWPKNPKQQKVGFYSTLVALHVRTGYHEYA